MEHNIIEFIKLNYPYIFSFMILLVGLFIIITEDNLIKKVFGLNIFLTAIIVFYISLSSISNSKAAIFDVATKVYVNPLPHVLMLTAIVVGISLTALAFALLTKIKSFYGSLSEREIITIIKSEESEENY